MVDLTHAGIHKFWHAFPDNMIYRVIACMESMESWTADDDSALEERLQKLGDILDDIQNIDLKQEDHLIELGSHLKTGRNLRILMALDQAYPGSAAKILTHAEKITTSNADAAGLFLRRNLIFERLRLLSRLFSQERLNLVKNCLEGNDYD